MLWRIGLAFHLSARCCVVLILWIYYNVFIDYWLAVDIWLVLWAFSQCVVGIWAATGRGQVCRCLVFKGTRPSLHTLASVHLPPLPATLGVPAGPWLPHCSVSFGALMFWNIVCVKWLFCWGFIFISAITEEVCLLSPQCSPLVSRLWWNAVHHACM